MTQHSRLANEHGQTMAEYVVVLGVITLAIVAGFSSLSGSVENVLRATLGIFL